MNNNLKQNAKQNGVLLGFSLMAITVYIYFVDLKLLTNVWFGVLGISFCVIFGILSILNFKKKSNGLITFKESFSVYFFTLIIGSALNCLLLIIFFQFVFSAEKVALIKETLTSFNLYIMKLNYATVDEMAKAKAYSDGMNPNDVMPIITSAIKYLLRDCLIGFLVALIFRNKRSL